MIFFDSVAESILGQNKQIVLMPKQYIARKERGGYTIFFNESLETFFFDTISYAFLQEIDGIKNCFQLAKQVAVRTKLPFLVCCRLLDRYLKTFSVHGFIDNQIANGQEIKIKKTKDFIPSAPDQIAILLTNECNLRCSHCGNENRDRKENELTLAEWCKIIDGCASSGVFILNVSGGEPFIRSDWYEILSHARAKKIEVAITSNSTLITEEIVKKIKELKTFNIHLSLDGVGEIHDLFRNKKGVFDHVVNTIKLFKQYGIPFGITTAVSKRNFGDLDNLANFLREQQIASWEVYWAIPLGCMSKMETLSPRELMVFAEKIHRFREQLTDTKIFVGDNLGYFDALKTQEDWHGCRAGLSICAIDSEGNVKGCPIHPNAFIEGNLRQRSLKEIWNDKNSFGYNRNHKTKLKKHCQKCNFSKICRGGCKASMYAQHQSFEYNEYCLKFIAEQQKCA